MGKLSPSVEKPVPRLRLGFVVVLLLVLAVAVIVLLVRDSHPQNPHGDGGVTWTKLQPHCTPLEVEVTLRERDLQPAWRALCFSAAGKVDRARETLNAMSGDDRAKTVEAIFELAHPIADAGDDRSAGPIMHLVVEFWPENYMATFHAGMADYALGNDTAAKPMLEKFLTMYEPQDVWHERAVQALRGIDVHQPLDQREAHFAE